jgi:HlyD family secretion protein
MRMLKIVLLVATVALGVGWFVQRSAAGLKDSSDPIPTARVAQGNVKLDVETTGDLETGQIITLVAPPVGGGTLQIVHLDPTGAVVRPGDVVLRFDPSEQEYNLEKNKSTLDEAEYEIAQAKAQAAVQDSDDRLALLKAQDGVRQAELQVQENPILPAIDAKKNLLALAEAKRMLAELKKDIQSHAASNAASVELAETKYDKAKVEMQRAEHNIHNMSLRAPIPGVVKVEENRMASGGFFFSGMTLPEFRAGDQAQPGTPIAQILDLTRMTIQARINETDRPSVQVGESAEIRVDAIPDTVYRGKVATISGMALRPMFSANPTRKFAMTVEIDHPDSRLRPGFTAHLTLVGQMVKSALYIPRVAIFSEEGKPFVYVKRGGEFRKRQLTVRYETASRALIQGLQLGAEVALVNPSQAAQSTAGAASPPPSPVGGATP